MSDKIIGIDIGATKTHIGVISSSKVIRELVYPTAATEAKEVIIAELIQGIEEVAGTDFTAIGIGVPGLVDEENGIIYDLWNIPSWKEVHLKQALQEHFQKPVKITNDANVFALGVAGFGKGKAYKNLVGITLGSGFGTGIIVDGKLYSGNLSSAGELGGLPYLDKTIEDYCSGKFFRNQYHTDGKSLCKLAEDGDARAMGIFYQYGQHLGNALQIVFNVLSPEAIFLGGSISTSFRLFERSLKEKTSTFPFPRVADRLVIEPSSIENISLLGAAALAQSVHPEEIYINH